MYIQIIYGIYMSDNQTSMIFRIDADLKKAFERVAKDNDQTASQMLRAYVRHVVEKHAATHTQGNLLTPKAADVTPPVAPAPGQSQPAKKKKKGPFDHVPRRGGR